MLNLKEVGTGWFVFVASLLLVALLLEWGAFRRRAVRKTTALALGAACGLGAFALLFTDLGASYPLREAFLAEVEEVEMEPRIQEGMEIYFKYGCPNCHLLRGWGTPAGPDLAGVVGRRGEAWVREYLVNPAVRRPGSTMIHYSFLTDEHLDRLLAFLAAVSGGERTAAAKAE